jgi:teichuronic acid biosynthesis glycosyltransferase TuaG
MDELVSIIVPVYNAASYIENTIEMVRRQTHSDWELILVDDASTDESVAVIRRMLGEGDIRLIQKSHNEGAAAARNTGLDAARGRYIAFLDADDVWMPDKLLRELAFMKDRQADFVFSAYEFGDEEARGTGKIVHVPDKLTYYEALTRTVIFTTTVLIDRERIPDELIRMPEVESEDTATWWQILRAGYTACGLDEVLAIYRRPAKSLSSNKLAAIRRIWRLYRRQEGLSVMHSAWCFLFWAYRATARRI